MPSPVLKSLKHSKDFAYFVNSHSHVFETVVSPCAGERLGMVEAQCERVRMLYRDCARPPPPPLQTDRRQVGAPSLWHFQLSV